MARTFTPRVNRHVTYFRAGTGKPVNATITAVGSVNGGIVLRIGHSQVVGDATTGILRAPISSLVANVPNTWRPA
jgi:hypothetical protein